MSLRLPCEFSVKEILPAIRSLMAEKLIKDCNVSEYRTASLLGVTPAAVSNYMKSKRGSSMKKILQSDPEFMSLVTNLSESLSTSGKGNLSAIYCILCSNSKRVLSRNGYTLSSCAYENAEKS
ncbi:transcriptional regulator [Sulfuracidifex metallicus]|uniref:Transcriptional regulator n=1 Tax=Sulfuracidifex metallicus DSM 6482 = JCM 9184 TaxID=523847 RepID=A0A6A9QFW1_SULME|nr:hypothetical protein [Sulfuracidifex metallicus]MUN27976.1 transcriptional regulator [Sulfuracidifex metallicus DSM 6482 = JCM 9184]WOE51476.1 transcriptional regulator [Sulfuracidifex metallicus DSM 6482 = JCM 9184]